MTDAERLDTIEIKLAHLERSLQELDQTILRQQRELTALTAHNRVLLERIGSLEGEQTPEAAEFERPPHY
jgi:SlyX protein